MISVFIMLNSEDLTYQWAHRNEVPCDHYHNGHICNKVDHNCLCIISYQHKASELRTQDRPVDKKKTELRPGNNTLQYEYVIG